MFYISDSSLSIVLYSQHSEIKQFCTQFYNVRNKQKNKIGGALHKTHAHERIEYSNYLYSLLDVNIIILHSIAQKMGNI